MKIKKRQFSIVSKSIGKNIIDEKWIIDYQDEGTVENIANINFTHGIEDSYNIHRSI